MDDKGGRLISAEFDHLTKTGLRARLVFTLFMLFIASVVAGALYITAKTTDYVKQAWGVEE